MQKGTILKNLWAGYESYFVYMGFPVRKGKAEASKVGGYGLYKINGKWKVERCEYYRCTLAEKEMFPVVGYVDINDVLIKGILAGIDDGERKTDEPK